jgi:hypothetical protein
MSTSGYGGRSGTLLCQMYVFFCCRLDTSYHFGGVFIRITLPIGHHRTLGAKVCLGNSMPDLQSWLTLNLRMTTIVAQPFNVIKWQLKFNPVT